MFAWWADVIKHKTYFDKEAFIEIYKLLGDINPLLDKWVITFEDNSFKNLIDLIDRYYQYLPNQSNIFKEIDENSIDKLRLWLTDKREIIENGFFHYENIDNEFAKKISNTLCSIEWTIQDKK